MTVLLIQWLCFFSPIIIIIIIIIGKCLSLRSEYQSFEHSTIRSEYALNTVLIAHAGSALAHTDIQYCQS